MVQLIQALHGLFWPRIAPEARDYRQNVEPFEVQQACQQAFPHVLRHRFCNLFPIGAFLPRLQWCMRILHQLDVHMQLNCSPSPARLEGQEGMSHTIGTRHVYDLCFVAAACFGRPSAPF